MQTYICAYDGDSTDNLKGFGDYVELWVSVDLEVEECDYGVRGSPVWLEVFDYDICKIDINDESYTLKEFKDKFSEAVVKDVLGWIDNAVDKVDLR